MNGGQYLLFAVAAGASVQELRKRKLVLARLVDVGNAQLRLPEERVVRTFENLPLLSDGLDHCFKGRTLVTTTEGPRLHLRNDLLQAPTDRAEIFEALFPEKPRLVGAIGTRPPSFD